MCSYGINQTLGFQFNNNNSGSILLNPSIEPKSAD